MIELITPRLLLRDYVRDDLDAVFALKSDAQAMRFLPQIRVSTREEAALSLEEVLADAQREKRRFTFLHIQDKFGTEAIGSVGYTVVGEEEKGKIVNAGYFLFPKHWGNGYAAEALTRLIRYAFEKDGVSRVKADCLKENTRSERVMQKSGMTRTEAAEGDRLYYAVVRG